MRNFKVTIWYCGSAYHGWQIQNNSVTVQEIFQRCLSDLLEQPTVVIGCSRTDAGVHAREYVLNFCTESTITCRGIVFGMNSRLPDDIGVKSCQEAPPDFHARFDCKGKQYEYLIHNSEYKNPFYMNTAYRSWYPIDEKKLDRAAKDFIGKHDFRSMCSSECTKENTVRTIKSFDVRRQGDMVIFSVSGDGFLYNMVRIMVGTLLFINEGKLGEGDIPRIIQSKDRTKAGRTVPPQGLYLNKVFY
ncbi:tRNA pseudouridine(38-40) synthase TruA [Ruminococcus sp. FC2018]|uniref:tRNA pseudouridine(38-40) synthase TruA n=1 Tax=Ruminococcus sp. FC2018 TaxID=1410617 RepID=UPI00048C6BBE|nr:tRNA pseudouridine(38-40) synthase TruA [Ruminococcus sp. FC2018]